jgi:hypothetical protein
MALDASQVGASEWNSETTARTTALLRERSSGSTHLSKSLKKSQKIVFGLGHVAQAG